MKSITLSKQAAETIKGLLRKKKVTQEEFAESLGITLRTLQNWLSLKNSMPIDKLDLMQKKLCISIEHLFGEVPTSYQQKKITALQTLVKLINPNFFGRMVKHYKRYIDWVHERMHSNPYPTTGYFCVFEKSKNTNHPAEYYNKVSILIKNNMMRNSLKLTIGYVVPIERMRIDYGSMVIKGDKVEVTRVFAGNSIVSSFHINNDNLMNTIKLDVITWVSEEHSTFVICCESTEIDMINHGMIKITNPEEKEIESGCHGGVVIFPKSAWHTRTN